MALEITIEGNVTEREKQIISFGINTFYATMYMPLAAQEDKMSEHDRRKMRAGIYYSTLIATQRQFPDLMIDIKDSEVKDPIPPEDR